MKFTRIKGENRPHHVQRLPLLGRIRLGVKKVSAKSGKEYPAEVDYFVVPPEVQRIYGERPKTIPVMMPVEDDTVFLRQFYAAYGSSQKTLCIGDGENAERRSETNVADRIPVPCPHPENCEYAKAHDCHARTILQVVLPGVNMGGVYQLSTGSVNSDIDIRSGIEMSRLVFGRVAWTPMVLQRDEKKIPDPDTGKMQTHWTVKLYPSADISSVNAIREDSRRIIEHQRTFALPEPVIEGAVDDTPVELVDDAGPEAQETTAPPSQYEVDLQYIQAIETMPELELLWKKITERNEEGFYKDGQYKKLAKEKDQKKKEFLVSR